MRRSVENDVSVSKADLDALAWGSALQAQEKEENRIRTHIVGIAANNGAGALRASACST